MRYLILLAVLGCYGTQLEVGVGHDWRSGGGGSGAFDHSFTEGGDYRTVDSSSSGAFNIDDVDDSTSAWVALVFDLTPKKIQMEGWAPPVAHASLVPPFNYQEAPAPVEAPVVPDAIEERALTVIDKIVDTGGPWALIALLALGLGWVYVKQVKPRMKKKPE